MRWLVDSVILIDHFNGINAATQSSTPSTRLYKALPFSGPVKTLHLDAARFLNYSNDNRIQFYNHAAVDRPIRQLIKQPARETAPFVNRYTGNPLLHQPDNPKKEFDMRCREQRSLFSFIALLTVAFLLSAGPAFADPPGSMPGKSKGGHSSSDDYGKSGHKGYGDRSWSSHREGMHERHGGGRHARHSSGSGMGHKKGHGDHGRDGKAVLTDEQRSRIDNMHKRIRSHSGSKGHPGDSAKAKKCEKSKGQTTDGHKK